MYTVNGKFKALRINYISSSVLNPNRSTWGVNLKSTPSSRIQIICYENSLLCTVGRQPKSTLWMDNCSETQNWNKASKCLHLLKNGITEEEPRALIITVIRVISVEILKAKGAKCLHYSTETSHGYQAEASITFWNRLVRLPWHHRGPWCKYQRLAFRLLRHTSSCKASCRDIVEIKSLC